MKVKTVPANCRCGSPVELDDRQPDFQEITSEDGKGYRCACGFIWRMTLVGSGYHLYAAKDLMAREGREAQEGMAP